MPNHKRNLKFLKQSTATDNNNIPSIKPIQNSNNQAQLKQIYQSVSGPTYNNKIVPISKKTNNRYYLPLQLKNIQQYQQPKGSVRYRSFLESHDISPVASVMRSNNLNTNKNNQTSSRRRIQSVNNLKNQLSALSGRKSNVGNETDRVNRSNNQNIQNQNGNKEMFKIRPKKSSHSGSLNKKVQQSNNNKNYQDRDRDDTPLHHPSLQTADQLELGKNQYKHGNYKQALKHFRKSLQSNPKNIACNYHIAMIHLKQQQYEQGLANLQKIIQLQPKFKKTVYLFASISLKHMNSLKKAIQYCNKGLQIYGSQNFIDLLFYKGKLLQQLQDIEGAIQTYQSVIKQKKDHVQALLNLSKCFYQKKLYNNSLSLLSSAIYYDKRQFKNQMLLLRIKICLQLGKLKQVKKDLIKLKQQRQKQDCQYLYLCGKLQVKQQKVSQALINFQKCLRQQINSSLQLKSNSLIQIVKAKINIKDFYSAYHHINRSKFLQIDTKQIKIFKYFIEGVIFLMKRKVDDAMRNFQEFVILMPNLQQDDYFNPMFYLYRAFGYFMQNKQELSIKDYEFYQKSNSLDKYTLYNLLLSKGIMKVQSKDFQSCRDYFSKCEQLFLTATNKMQPYIYRAISYVQEAKHLSHPYKQKQIESDEKVEDDIKVLELVFLGLKELDKAYDFNQGNSNLLFIRALIYAYLGKYDEALDDIIKAISKSEQNIPKYFFYRALLQQTLQNKKQALNDFNICTNLDPNYAIVYLQRSKLFFFLQNYSKGLQDLQKYNQLKPQEDVQALKASLYYVNGLYPMADQSVQNVKDQNSYNYLKFHILLKLLRIQEAMNYLDPDFESDRMIMNIIAGDYTQVSESILSKKKLKYFNIIHYYHYLGVAFFNNGQYDKALQQFIMAMKQCNLRDLQKKSSSSKKQIEAQQNLGQRDINCIHFNIFLSYLKLNQKRKAYQIFVRDILPANQTILKSQFMANFSHALFQSIKSKNEQHLHIQQKEQTQVQIFTNLFTDLSEQLVIQMPTFILRTKLCYLNVFSQKLKTEFSPRINTQFVLKSLNMKQIQNRPQPPWVKRQTFDEGLIFTDQIQNINIEFQTTQNDQEDQQQYDDDQQRNQEQQQQQQNQEQEQEEQSVQEEKFDPKRFRDQMKLDFDIQKKLQKIMQKKRKASTEQ